MNENFVIYENDSLALETKTCIRKCMLRVLAAPPILDEEWEKKTNHKINGREYLLKSGSSYWRYCQYPNVTHMQVYRERTLMYDKHKCNE